MKNKNIPFSIISFLAILLAPTITWAFCPVCVVAVGAGLGLARWIGIDDTVSGIWIGGLLIAFVGWLINFLKNKKWTFPFYGPFALIATYTLVIIPMYYQDILGHPAHTIWGIDKLIFSISLGSLIFIASQILYEWMRQKNNHKPFFPFQKIVMPIIFLLIASLFFYVITI